MAWALPLGIAFVVFFFCGDGHCTHDQEGRRIAGPNITPS